MSEPTPEVPVPDADAGTQAPPAPHVAAPSGDGYTTPTEFATMGHVEPHLDYADPDD